MQKTDRNPDDYLAGLPDDVRDDMTRLDAIIAGIFTGQARVLWEGVFWGGSEQEIIGYGDLIQKQSRGRTVEWFMVGLALQKNYISVYVNAVEDKQYVAEKYKESLGKVKVGKSSISFKTLADVDIDTLTRVLRIARDQLDQS
jgi:hypothetical protein